MKNCQENSHPRSRVLFLRPPPDKKERNSVRDFVYGCWCNGKRIGGMQMPPLNDIYSATRVQDAGVAVEFLDARLDLQRFATLSRDSFADVAVVVMMSSVQSFRGDVAVLTQIKGLNPRVKTVLYGSCPSSMPQSCLREGAVDVIVLREPEATLRCLCPALLSGEQLTEIQGIRFRDDKRQRCVGFSGQPDPEAEVQLGNVWYVSDQFDRQLGRPGTRELIRQRWKFFEAIFSAHLTGRPADAPLDPSMPLRYLDAGCGDGINLQWAEWFFKEKGLDVEVTALDYNSLRIDRVRQRQLADDAHVASLLEIPFADETFDMILCNQVLEHIPDYRRALTEIRRVLKPGGLLVLGVPNEGCLLARLRNNLLQRSILKETDHVNFFTGKSVEEALANGSFKTIHTYHEGFFLPHSWFHYGVTRLKFGAILLSLLGRLLPSQSAGLIAHCVRL